MSPSTFVIVRRNKKNRNKPYEYPQILHPSHYFPTTANNGVIASSNPNFELRRNPNQQMLAPYTSIVTTQETTTTSHHQQQQQQQREEQRQIPPPPPPPPITPYRGFEYNNPNFTTSPPMTTIPTQPSIPMQTQPFRTPVTSYQYPSNSTAPHWNRTGTNVINQPIRYAPEATHNYLQRNVYYPNRTNVIERTFERKQEPRVLHYYTGFDYFAAVDPSDAVLTRHHPPMTGPGSAIRYSANPSYHHQDDYIKSTL